MEFAKTIIWKEQYITVKGYVEDVINITSVGIENDNLLQFFKDFGLLEELKSKLIIELKKGGIL